MGEKRGAGATSYHDAGRNLGCGHGTQINFGKLTFNTLENYIKHHGVTVRSGSTHVEMAIAVARHFEGWRVNEEEILSHFCHIIAADSPRRGLGEPEAKRRRRARFSSFESTATDGATLPYSDDSMPAIGDEVAAKIPNDDAWILARVVMTQPEIGAVQVQDEDDVNQHYSADCNDVVRLTDSPADLSKGDSVLAVFPDTTSFYMAQVHKLNRHGGGSGGGYVILKFYDDEDETGRTPYRTVPSRYVLRVNDRERRPEQTVSKPRPKASNTGGGTASGGSSKSGGREGQRRGSGGKTYGQMIAHALNKLPHQCGAFQDICNIVEADFSDVLNWKLESDLRKTPVWKSSVRKILFSNSRFTNVNPADKHLFTFSKSERVNRA
ncbi:unnamed protein product [Chrysoparadoxa australica]